MKTTQTESVLVSLPSYKLKNIGIRCYSLFTDGFSMFLNMDTPHHEATMLHKVTTLQAYLSWPQSWG